MEENGGKSGKLRTLQEGKAGKLKGTESNRWKKVKESKVSGKQWALGSDQDRRYETKNSKVWSQADGKK